MAWLSLWGHRIKLFKGLDSQEYQKISAKLHVFLKGPKKSKELLQRECPELYSTFQRIWKVRNQHLVQYLPSSYSFFLLCCYQADCTHPVCRSGSLKPQLPGTQVDHQYSIYRCHFLIQQGCGVEIAPVATDFVQDIIQPNW